jgi:putative oxidoreductase
MAQPVEFRKFTPQDSRGDLMRRLQDAPEDHAEALLSLYDLLEKLHEKGLIDTADGLLSASTTVVDRLVDVVSSKQAVSALRMGLMLANLLETIDINQVHSLLTASEGKPPSLLRLGRDALSEDARRGLSAGVGLLSVFGAALRPKGVQPTTAVEPFKQPGPQLQKGKFDALKKLPLLSTKKSALIVARTLVAVIFIMNGLNVISQALATHELIAHGLPENIVSISIGGARALQLVAGTALIFGVFPRLASLALIAFLIPATIMAHPFWQAFSTPLYPVQLINFLKNVCMCGGLLFIAATKDQPTLFPRSIPFSKDEVR